MSLKYNIIILYIIGTHIHLQYVWTLCVIIKCYCIRSILIEYNVEQLHPDNATNPKLRFRVSRWPSTYLRQFQKIHLNDCSSRTSGMS